MFEQGVKFIKPELAWKGKMPLRTHSQPMIPVETPEVHGLYKLVLTVAQACNLRCTYCYAEGGPYGEDISSMTESIAQQAVRTFFTRYRPIQTLQFFGGEPTLNLKTMKATVAEVRLMIQEALLAEEPHYGIVTNAMQVTKELVDFYKDTKMKITVSHDGPPAVQDTQRPGLRGEPSWSVIDRNLAKFRSEGVSFDVQCTYTRKHHLKGFSVPYLLRYFHDLGATRVDIVPVTVPKGDPLDVFYSDMFDDMVEGYKEAVRLSFHATRSGSKLRFGMVDEALSLLNPGKADSKHYCNAGVSTLTVAANGDVYPCFMFINKKDFHMGHVSTDHGLAAFGRDPNRGIDKGCPGRQFMMNGEISSFLPDDILKNAVVDIVLKCIEEILDIEELRLGIKPARI